MFCLNMCFCLRALTCCWFCFVFALLFLQFCRVVMQIFLLCFAVRVCSVEMALRPCITMYFFVFWTDFFDDNRLIWFSFFVSLYFFVFLSFSLEVRKWCSPVRRMWCGWEDILSHKIWPHSPQLLFALPFIYFFVFLDLVWSWNLHHAHRALFFFLPLSFFLQMFSSTFRSKSHFVI